MSRLVTSDCYPKNDAISDAASNVTSNNNVADVEVKPDLTSAGAGISTDKAELTSAGAGIDEQGKTEDRTASRDEAPVPESVTTPEPVESTAVTSDTLASTE